MEDDSGIENFANQCGEALSMRKILVLDLSNALILKNVKKERRIRPRYSQ
jgi:hypothetical protein